MISAVSLSKRLFILPLTILCLIIILYYHAPKVTTPPAPISAAASTRAYPPPVSITTTTKAPVRVPATYAPPISVPAIPPSVNWSSFAYSQYVTGRDRLCHSVMIFEALHRLESKPDRVLMYPKTWNPNDEPKLIKARDEYNVKLIPVEILMTRTPDRLWSMSFTKLTAFRLTQYERVLQLDSDGTLLRHMDDLFFVQPGLIAMPRAYWLQEDKLTSQLMLVQPNEKEFTKLRTLVEKGFMSNKKPVNGDMDLLDDQYKSTALVLPHRPYTLLSGEFLHAEHSSYLGSDDEWDPNSIFNETKFVHFSDWPYPKPWNRRPMNLPKCKTEKECRNQEIWSWLFADFRERMKRVCGILV